jgi:hypothetical protein
MRVPVLHGGDHVPTLRVEVARRLEPIARGATSNEHGLHRLHRGEYSGDVPDLLQSTGRDLVLTRLVEVLLIEALRSTLG